MTPQHNEEDAESSIFAEPGLIKAMKALGFELSHHEGIADWFVKDEGTSELTVFGAREMVALIAANKRGAEIQARGEEVDRFFIEFEKFTDIGSTGSDLIHPESYFDADIEDVAEFFQKRLDELKAQLTKDKS
jgi:hypothetical protein